MIFNAALRAFERIFTPPFRSMLWKALGATLLLLVGLSILGNILALILYFFPGINLIAFYIINGYLLGREYFEFAACRLRSEEDARAFYNENAFTVFSGGVIIALFVSIPVLNLLTPLFAAAMMTHLHKSLSQKQGYSTPKDINLH